jgi:hypothetical protein
MPPKKPKADRLKPPKAPRKVSTTDLIRRIYERAGATSAYRYKKAHASNFQRLLTAAGKSENIANVLTDKEALDLEAAYSNLKPGRTALTLPERLTIVWMEKAHFKFGGVFPNVDMSGDFFSQFPLEGGRSKAGGGQVSDVFVSAAASKTAKGISISIDGIFFHQKTATAARDTAQGMLLRSRGYQVERITDAEIYQPGVLDRRMREILHIN